MRNILVILILITAQFSYAQLDGSTKDGRAQKLYNLAKEDFKWSRWEVAEEKLLAAIDRDEEYLDAMNLLADVYANLNQIDNAKLWTKKVVDLNPNYSPNLMLILASLEHLDGNFEAALPLYEKYIKMAPPTSSNYRAAKLGAAKCEFATWAMANPVDYNIENLGMGVNTEHDEYFPAMTADESELIFTRAIPVGRATYYVNDRNEDFFFSQKQADGSWGEAMGPGRPLNTSLNEGAPTLSADGIYLIFAACDLGDMGSYGPDKKGYGRCDLFVSVRQGDTWKKPVNMGATINTKHWESQPSFSSDGRTIYFIRGRYDRYGERHDDIMISELVDGKWSKARRLPPNINTEGSEESVFIHPDNKTLYFSSDGHVGMGGMDIFVSRKQPDGTWGDPVNLGYPINTVDHENSFLVTATGEHAIIASNRDGGQGGMDLYKLTLPESARPQPITYLKGRITDIETKKPVEAFFRLINVNTGDTIAQANADKVTGKFLVVMPDDGEFSLYAEYDGYLFHSERFEIDLSEMDESFQKNIELQPLKAGGSVILKNVFFDTDKFELLPKSKVELEKLAEMMTKNPYLRIEISGHTDNQGSSSANQTLSENRAQAVSDYLVRVGIAAERLEHKGYGQTKPIASNDNEEGRQLNRRTEFKIID